MNSNLLARVIVGMMVLAGWGCQQSMKAPPVADLKNDTNAVMTPEAGSGVLGRIERLDPGIDSVLAPDAKLEILVKGLDWAEGPVWSKRDKCLYWSDVPQNVAYRWSEGKGASVFLKPSGYWGTTPRGGEPGSNGLTFDPQGRLVLCQHGERRVGRLEKDGKMVAVVDRFEGKRFNGPNDIVVKSLPPCILSTRYGAFAERLRIPIGNCLLVPGAINSGTSPELMRKTRPTQI